jgi:CRISPR-associated protein (TIGR02710 family)
MSDVTAMPITSTDTSSPGEGSPDQSISAALLSVGGSVAPLLHVLHEHRPGHVWYFCSAGSRAKAEEIQQQLPWHPAPRFIEVEQFEALGPCYQELRLKLPEILAETRIPASSVLVDYTGGTKTMSAALVLAGTELFERFSYVGGTQREKGGLGITVDGKERVHYQGNPWSQLSIREIEKAVHLWAGSQFEASARVLREVGPRTPRPLRFEAIATLADGLAARHRLDFSRAKGLLKTAEGRLRPMFEGRTREGPLVCAQAALAACEACSDESPGEPLLRELLDNIIRTATQGRYEDAAARLYRAMELRGQLWLTEATEGLFTFGKCKPVRSADVPAPLMALSFCKPDDRGEIRLSLEQSFRALHALGDPRVALVNQDLNQVDGKGKSTSRWRQATEKRNSSILGHGIRPIGSEGFEQMKRLTGELLGFDLSQIANPIPPLDPQWLE